MIWQKNSLGERFKGRHLREVDLVTNRSGRGLNIKLNFKTWEFIKQAKKEPFRICEYSEKQYFGESFLKRVCSIVWRRKQRQKGQPQRDNTQSCTRIGEDEGKGQKRDLLYFGHYSIVLDYKVYLLYVDYKWSPYHASKKAYNINISE